MDDLISRQAVLEEVKNYTSMLWEKYHEPFPESTIMELIQALPTVQPKTDDILSYIDRISNSGMGKKKALEYLRKYVEKSAE